VGSALVALLGAGAGSSKSFLGTDKVAEKLSHVKG